jgi:hypothetical protein
MMDIDSIVKKRNDNECIKFIVVAESDGHGVIVSLNHNQYEAESVANEVVSRLNLLDMVDALDILNGYKPIAAYRVNGNSNYISNSVWLELCCRCNIYVVSINLYDGGVKRFIREREFCSELLTIEDHMKRFDKVMRMFKGFGFGAN